MKNTYIVLDDAHPLGAGFDGAGRIIGGTRLMAVAAEAGTATPFVAIPDFPDLPMEEVYPRAAPEGAAVVAREHASGGRVVHVPWNLGATFWEVMADDHRRLIENAVRWALGAPPRVEVGGKGLLDVAAREGDGVTLVLMTNLTNPMMWKGPLRETYPVGAQTVSAALPPGRTGGGARLLVAGADARAEVRDGRLLVTVPAIDLAEVVRIDWT